MKFISITGPKDDIDRVAEKYLSKYDIHLENALSELKSVKNLRPYIETNPFKKSLDRAEELLLQINSQKTNPEKEFSAHEAQTIITSLDNRIKELTDVRIEASNQKTQLLNAMDKIEPFRDLDFILNDILSFRFIKYRFGRMPNEQFEQFEQSVYDGLDAVFIRCRKDAEYSWGVYFVPETEAGRVDSVLSTMHFERYYLPDEYNGTLEEAYTQLKDKVVEADLKITECSSRIQKLLEKSQEDLYAAYQKLETQNTNFDIRKMAACTKENTEVYYILCGWMSEENTNAFEREIRSDDLTNCIIEGDEGSIGSTPPTKLKNNRFIRPFEMFVKMYGLPAYNELDPTLFVALTYSVIFGAMFGDVGQGLCLTIGGFLLYRFKKANLAAIISCAGIFSTFFGFMFGSIFGFEGIIKPIWLAPVSKMQTIPFIGKINTVFIVSIAFGMGLILLNIIFHIVNAIKAKDKGNTYFDPNGLAGLVFYGALAFVLALFMSGKALPAGAVLAALFILPLLFIALKEPLLHILQKKSKILPDGKVMFIVQAFFELFEVLLSYFSNTLSFVRIGAFAVSHAAMMEVVLMLAGVEHGSTAGANWFVIILGNIFVSGMEGLIVGIQVLRLEYYELFSRFYKGTGREFLSFYHKPAKQLNQ